MNKSKMHVTSSKPWKIHHAVMCATNLVLHSCVVRAAMQFIVVLNANPKIGQNTTSMIATTRLK